MLPAIELTLSLTLSHTTLDYVSLLKYLARLGIIMCFNILADLRPN